MARLARRRADVAVARRRASSRRARRVPAETWTSWLAVTHVVATSTQAATLSSRLPVRIASSLAGARSLQDDPTSVVYSASMSATSRAAE